MAITNTQANLPNAVVDDYAFMGGAVDMLQPAVGAVAKRWLRIELVRGGQTFFGFSAIAKSLVGRPALLFSGWVCAGGPPRPAEAGEPAEFYVFARRSGLRLASLRSVVMDPHTHGEPIDNWTSSASSAPPRAHR